MMFAINPISKFEDKIFRFWRLISKSREIPSLLMTKSLEKCWFGQISYNFEFVLNEFFCCFLNFFFSNHHFILWLTFPIDFLEWFCSRFRFLYSSCKAFKIGINIFERFIFSITDMESLLLVITSKWEKLQNT